MRDNITTSPRSAPAMPPVAGRKLTKRAIQELTDAALFLAGGCCEICGISKTVVAFGETADGRVCLFEYLKSGAVWRDAETGAVVDDDVEHDGGPPDSIEPLAYLLPRKDAVVVRCSRHRPTSGAARRCC